MNESARNSEPPDEPYLRSQPSVLSPASPKPLQFPQPTNIPVLENMMDVGFNQTEAHMNDPAMRNTDLRPDAWRDPSDSQQQQPDDGAGHASPFSTGGDTAESMHHFDGDANALPHSSETAPNGLDAQHVQISNGMPHHTNSHLPPEHTPGPITTHAPSSSSDPSVPAAESEPEPAPTNADAISNSNAVVSDQSQPTPGDLDVQALLDTLQTSTAPAAEHSVAPSATSMTVTTTLSDAQSQDQLPLPSAEASSPLSTSGLGSLPSGLPPRPPPQEQPLMNPNYVHSQHIRDYHPHAAHPAVQTHPRSNSLSHNEASASLQQSGGQSAVSEQSQQRPFSSSNNALESRREFKIAAGQTPTADDQPWTADIQRKYDQFMEEERRYVNEARWDQFPAGSRLFVGNLSSEKVTKRDIFHVFHGYGDLAQISIKQAYGFVQFLRTEDCTRALNAEQGRQIRDKRIHLEVSKPQKSKSQPQQAQNNRRSRTPERGNRGRAGKNVDRYVSSSRGSNGRGRDDGYRPSYRSPSPRGYRDRYDDSRYRARSRSPGYDQGYRSPRRDLEDDLPLPRRQPRDVPDVQIIALDQLDRDFLSWVEKSFTERGVRVDVLILSPRLSEEAIVRRQIMEGVLAVSKLKRANQNSSKIGLTIFKRKQGTRDVQFEDYDNLDPNICVELVLREKTMLGTPANVPTYGGYSGQYSTPQYGYQQPSAPPPQLQPPAGYPPGYGQPPMPYSVPQPNAHHGAPLMPGIANNMDPNNLQNLLSTLNQASQNQPQTGGPQYGNPAQPQVGNPQQPGLYGQQQQQDPYAAYNLGMAAMRPGGQVGGQPPPQGVATSPTGQAPPNMQDILARLGSYRQ